jgi:hypothetical protein
VNAREYIDIVPTWRKATQPIRLVYNPRREDQRYLFGAPWFGVRFVMLGDSNLIVGKAEDFMHHDAHTDMRKNYSSNINFMGMLFNKNSPKTEYSDISYSLDQESSETLVLLKESRYGKREIGWLNASSTWRNFVSGIWDFPALEPLQGEGMISNPNDQTLPHGKFLFALHGDGFLYLGDDNESIWPFMKVMDVAEKKTLPRMSVNHVAQQQVIGRVTIDERGAKVVILTGEGSDPVAMLKDNVNWKRAFRSRELDYQIPNRHAIASAYT